MTVPELHERARRTLQILDVRERGEWDAGPHPRLGPRALPRHRRRPRGIDPAGRSRSSAPPASARAVAASLLQRYGAREVIHVVDGGVPRWQREGWPIER